MIDYTCIKDAQDYLVKHWEEDGKKVIEKAFFAKREIISMDDFLSHCTACGGNWGGMFLTGIKELFPSVYEVIPDDMGVFAWACICYTMLLCGVDTTKE